MFKFFLTNFEELVERLQKRGIDRSQLLSIKEEIEKKNSLLNFINEKRAARNQLSTGPQNAETVKKLKEEIEKKEKELTILEKEIQKLISQIPNPPALDVPHSEEGNRLI